MGTTARASDTRNFLSFIFNGFFIYVCYLIALDYLKYFLLAVILLTFLASHNFLLSFGFKLPFEAENERLRTQKDYANIVFGNKVESTYTMKKQTKRLVINIFIS